MIRGAQDTLHLQTYIYEADETGRMVGDALMDAARRKVQVYVLLDGYASQALPSEFIDELKAAGVHFRFFEPIFRSKHFYFGRRLHNKVVVADSRYSLVGGVNITNRYNDMPDKPAWLDFALYAEGPVSRDACTLCWTNWKGFPRRIKKNPCADHVAGPGEGELSLVRLRRNDWVRNKLEISNSYLEMFNKAKSHITILSSYALPGIIFRKNLEKAVRRGVNVRMIITGESDVMLVKHAERYWYDWLMRNNIAIFEYTRNVLHGKLAVCDSEWMTIGSYNVNNLSAYASIELNFDVKDPALMKKVEQQLEDIINNDCVYITPEKMATTANMLRRLGQWFSYNLIRIAFNVFTFYYRRRKN